MAEKIGKRRVKMSKSGVEIVLSALRGFEEAKVSVEQYPTDSEVAAIVLWDAYMKGDIEGKVIVDLGSGTGILGIGTMLLNAQKVYFVESDGCAMEIAKDNRDKVESEGLAEFCLMDVNEFDKKVDVVIMNPPFGVKSEHSDRVFLEKAFSIADVVYSFHKSETKGFIERFANAKNFAISQVTDFSFPLKATMRFHEKKIKRINVSCFRLLKNK
ncbi:MAG: METTL5 family protein [Nanoarchaeota archaeon]|nr:METTL5 family protein [Nanoarchaeota archaeon]